MWQRSFTLDVTSGIWKHSPLALSSQQPINSRPQVLLRVAGLLAWATAGLPYALAHLRGDASGGIFLWIVPYVAFLLAFLLSTEVAATPRSRPYRIAGLVVQTVTALLLVRCVSSGFEGLLLTVVAGQLPMILGGRLPLLWVSGQTLALGTLMLWTGSSLAQAGLTTFAYAAFQAFALGAAHLARSEAEARRKLADVNAQLVAAQSLLKETAGLEERLRISRDLHDAVGHHLTALNLQLEVASHLAQGKALEQVQRAQGVAKLLMSEVRSTVSALRSEPAKLRSSLLELADGIEKPQIVLRVPESFQISEPGPAEVLLRCVQEIITNAVRHSSATTLQIEVDRNGSGIEVRARDDGQGTAALRPGLGLKGMKERLEQVGGRLTLHSQPGKGFEVNAWIPEAPQ